jgi:hypothetical protein
VIKIKEWAETNRYVSSDNQDVLVFEFKRPWNAGTHWRTVEIHNDAVRAVFNMDAYKVDPVELEQFVTDYCRRALNA